MVVFVLLVFSFLLTSITTLPFVLVSLLCSSVVLKTPLLFVLAFLTGLYLDVILVRSLGQSSVFFLIFIFLLFLYDRKFEIQTVPFVFFAGFLGSIGYLLIFGYSHVLEQAIVSSIIAVSLFKGLVIFKERKIVDGN